MNGLPSTYQTLVVSNITAGFAHDCIAKWQQGFCSAACFTFSLWNNCLYSYLKLCINKYALLYAYSETARFQPLAFSSRAFNHTAIFQNSYRVNNRKKMLWFLTTQSKNPKLEKTFPREYPQNVEKEVWNLAVLQVSSFLWLSFYKQWTFGVSNGLLVSVWSINTGSKTQMWWKVKTSGLSVRRTKYHPVPARGYTKVQVKALELVQENMQNRKTSAFFSQPNHVKCTLAEEHVKDNVSFRSKSAKYHDDNITAGKVC